MPASTKSLNSAAKSHNNSTTTNSYANKIATMCAMHGIPSGAGGNLGTFMRALNQDKLLALNFWSLVVKITDQINAQENGSNAALLEAISHGVTGKSVAEAEAAGGEPQWLIKQMAAMLAGEDIQIPAAASLTPAAAAPVPVAAQQAPVSAEVSAVAIETQALVLTPPPVEVSADADTRLQPFLIRIDRDRSRMVLAPEGVTSKPMMGQRALFGPEAREKETRATRVPLECYGERSANISTRMIAFAALMAVALGGAAFVARGDAAATQKSVRAAYDSAWSGVKALGNWASRIAE